MVVWIVRLDVLVPLPVCKVHIAVERVRPAVMGIQAKRNQTARLCAQMASSLCQERHSLQDVGIALLAAMAIALGWPTVDVQDHAPRASGVTRETLLALTAKLGGTTETVGGQGICANSVQKGSTVKRDHRIVVGFACTTCQTRGRRKGICRDGVQLYLSCFLPSAPQRSLSCWCLWSCRRTNDKGVHGPMWRRTIQ